MPRAITVTDHDADQDCGRIRQSRVSLPGDPEDMFIDEACRDLKLPAFRERFIELASSAHREQATYKQFLLDLLQVELADRDVRRQQRLLRLARFSRPKHAVPDLHRTRGVQGHRNRYEFPFTEWDKTFADARFCAAIADRITFRCTLVQTGTESYRLQTTQEPLLPAKK
ncbi:ATP-binding protein [Streptomyces sp. NPDC088246]|uniref:ATP-binding protein n=1 Tax=Streptomyces sp. NPDC088246 TaxID=3365842 RepID=UPI00380D3825